MKRSIALAVSSGLAIGVLVVLTSLNEVGEMTKSSEIHSATETDSWAATGPMDMSKVPERISVSGRSGKVVGFVLSDDVFRPVDGPPVVYSLGTGKPIGELTKRGIESIDMIDP